MIQVKGKYNEAKIFTDPADSASIAPVPNLVGMDIGCGMETVRLRESHIEMQKPDHLIREKIPSSSGSGGGKVLSGRRLQSSQRL